jgi:hypothetical protein
MNKQSLAAWKGTPHPSTFKAQRTLTRYGLKRIAEFRIELNTFRIVCYDQTASRWERSIYAFVINDEIIRIGSSKHALGKRLRAFERDITAALNGHYHPTPKSESDLWKSELREHRRGSVWARPGTLFVSPMRRKPISGYQDEESELIALHMPRLNRGKHR